MKKKTFGLIIIFLLFAFNLYAANGDLIVSGNVGIGTTTPGYTLDVTGNINAYKLLQDSNFALNLTSNRGWVQINPNSCVGCYNNLVQAGDKVILFSNGTVNTGSLVIGPWGSGGIRITNMGNVGIGTVPHYQLELSTDTAAKLSTSTWTITSDARLKTNIQPYAKGLKEILQINPVSYQYNGKGGVGHMKGCKDPLTTDKCVETDIVDSELLSKTNVGVLAQEIQSIVPETVTSHKGKINADDTVETDLLDFNSHALTFILINAVKELNAKIDSLNQQIADLKTKVK